MQDPSLESFVLALPCYVLQRAQLRDGLLTEAAAKCKLLGSSATLYRLMCHRCPHSYCDYGIAVKINPCCAEFMGSSCPKVVEPGLFVRHFAVRALHKVTFKIRLRADRAV
jgi:hypothetical protein